jgi:[protein-PII] uridylyltransferase
LTSSSESAPVNVAPKPSEELRAARQEVLDRHELTGAALRAALVNVVDTWLGHQLGDAADVAVVAVGGHGRQDPAPGSDLDLVLVHRGGDVKAVADRLWYPVWDAGVGLDHSVRTVGEALSVAAGDLKAALGLLDARHVAGDQALTDELRGAAFNQWRRDARKRLPELDEATTARWETNGELAFLLEPDLKEARGGLRDVHALRAVAATWLADVPSSRIDAPYLRLLDVRSELHRRSSRPSDRLVLQEQSPVSRALGYTDAESLIRDVSEAGRAIAFASDETWRRVRSALRPARRWRQRAPVRRPLADGVIEQEGEVVLARDVDPTRDPVLVLRVAAAAAQQRLPIAPHTVERLASAPPLAEPWPSSALDWFVALLGAGAGAVAVIEALDQAGLFVRLVPEWQNVRCKPQRNAVHRFTVDRHLVEAAANAAQFTRRVSRPDLLLLGAWLHDIGKGWPGDHTDAGVEVIPRITARLGMSAADTQILVSLVRHHLLLPDTATRRDLDDPATVRLVADAVGDRDTLDLLHALTEADALATGPAAWGDWKAGLIADLVRRTSAVLTGAPPPASDVLDDGQRELAEAGALAVEVRQDRVTVVAPDRPGLLWRWAGVLALHRLTIRGATATSVGHVAVTVFDVTPRFGSAPDWDKLRADVRRAYDDALPIAAHLAERERAYISSDGHVAPPRVVWMDGASESATVVEVRAHDAVGLLYRLTRALADVGLDVRSARISTLGAEVVDAFYVVESDGAVVDDETRRREIETQLLTAVSPTS